jgi:anti-sigma factor RsiW
MSEIEARCAPFAGDLSALLDAELDAARAAEVDDHVRGCAACARRLDALRALDVALREVAIDAAADEPQRLERIRARALSRLQGEASRHRRAPRRPRRWLLPAVAGTLAAAAAALFVVVPRQPAPVPIATPPLEQATRAEPAAPPAPRSGGEKTVAANELQHAPPAMREAPQLGAAAVSDEETPPATTTPIEASDEELELAVALDELEIESSGDLELVEQLDLVESLGALDATPERG